MFCFGLSIVCVRESDFSRRSSQSYTSACIAGFYDYAHIKPIPPAPNGKLEDSGEHCFTIERCLNAGFGLGWLVGRYRRSLQERRMPTNYKVVVEREQENFTKCGLWKTRKTYFRTNACAEHTGQKIHRTMVMRILGGFRRGVVSETIYCASQEKSKRLYWFGCSLCFQHTKKDICILCDCTHWHNALIN